MITILVADDEKYTRKLLRAILENEHYTVKTAINGAEALSIMDTEHIDLVLLDVMMPEIDGYEFTKLIRSVNNDLPILMVSAKQLPDDRKKGFVIGIDDYMSKPFDEEELILRIKALLRRSKIAMDRKIEIGTIVLDYDSMIIQGNGHSVTLPQKEFLLLYKLLSYPEKIFTRLQLMDEIWGLESNTGWETVTVHVARLRKHVECFPEIEIESVRGLGYRAVRRIEDK
ncbi:response regulator transcription factor [Enterococcus mundtii]|uniref:response regulator transcription factor n=1 Tax=Enterococcus mundtii TaxID=53346 RepID=UPI001FD4128E|nr:response regulator transcription factor [Enterococcus casseliflavus]